MAILIVVLGGTSPPVNLDQFFLRADQRPEAFGEQGCVERLLHRVWDQLLCAPERLQVVEPFRGQRDALVHPDGEVLTDCVRKAFLKLNVKVRRDAGARSLLLILLDTEGDCPATLAPRLLDVARKALPADAAVACVLALVLWASMPVASAWLLGALLGIELISEGVALGWLAWIARRT